MHDIYACFLNYMEKMVNTLLWAAILQGLLLGLLYFFSRKYSSWANNILGLFLLAFVLEALTNVSVDRIGGYSVEGYFTLPEVKLLLPVLFLHYVLEKLGRTSAYLRFLKIHYVLAFGFIAITFLNILLFLLKGMNISQLLDVYKIEMVFMTMQYYAFFLTISALAMSIHEILRYTSLIKNTYSDLEMLQIRWLWYLILGVVPIILVWGLELIWISTRGTGSSPFISVIWFLMIAFIYFISFRAYQQKNLMENTLQRSEEKRKEDPPAKKSDPQEHLKLGRELTSYMESSEIYLQDNLTLYELSRAINVSPRLISACINQNFRNNFAEWVNSFRVEAALSKLNDPSYSHLSVEGIGLESGFKSRSAMYTAFQRQTGHSPGYFRKA